jgi:hypothetical protein
LFSF